MGLARASNPRLVREKLASLSRCGAVAAVEAFDATESHGDIPGQGRTAAQSVGVFRWLSPCGCHDRWLVISGWSQWRFVPKPAWAMLLIVSVEPLRSIVSEGVVGVAKVDKVASVEQSPYVPVSDSPFLVGFDSSADVDVCGWTLVSLQSML